MPKDTCLHVGGVIAMGFSRNGDFLLVISHSGRGVYTTVDWQRVARDAEPAFPENGIGIGIGPIDGECIEITELNYDTGELNLNTLDGSMTLRYESGTIEITNSASKQNHN